MNKTTLVLASTLFVLGTGAATAGDTRATFGDFSPTHYTQLDAKAGSARTTAGVSGLGSPATQQKTPTYLLPRELQWMDRPQDLSNGSSR